MPSQRRTLLLPLLLASAGIACKAEEVASAPSPPSIDAALANLPSCEPVVDDGRIDLVTGCFDGAICVGMTYGQMREAIGYDAVCGRLDEPVDTVECAWDRQVLVQFSDKDGDGDPDDDSVGETLQLTNGLEAGTAEGLGVFASTSCFVDLFGAPDKVTWQVVRGDYAMVEAIWVGWGLTLVDDDGPPGSLDPDGRVDHIETAGAR